MVWRGHSTCLDARALDGLSRLGDWLVRVLHRVRRVLDPVCCLLSGHDGFSFGYSLALGKLRFIRTDQLRSNHRPRQGRWGLRHTRRSRLRLLHFLLQLGLLVLFLLLHFPG